MPDNDPKSRLWKAIERKRISHERRATTRIHKGLRQSIQGVLDNLERFGPEDALRDLESELDRKPMEEAYQDVYVTIGVSFARDSYQAFKSRKDDQAVEDQWVRDMRNFATTEAGERITSVNRTTLKRIRSVLETGVEDGLGIEEIAANMEDSTAIHRVRARMIARTEIVSASNKGSLMGAKATGLNLQKEWIDTPDDRTRPSHVKAGEQDPVDHSEDFKVGGYDAEYPGDPSLPADESIHCFTGDTLVSFDSCKKSIRSIYSGKLITIKTARGYKLTGTPNHPVLTDSGFIRLDEVNHSTNLICCPLNRKITHNLDVDNIPISFKKLHNASAATFGVMRMSGVDVNLYSRIPDSKVDIVNVNSLLWDNFKTFAFKFFPKDALQVPNLTQSLFFCFCLLYGSLNIKFIRHISHSLISCLNLFRSFFIRHLRPFKGFGFALGSDVDIPLFESPANNVPVNSHFLSNSIFTHTRSVEGDNFVNVNFKPVPSKFDAPFFKVSGNGISTTPHDVSNIVGGLSRFVEVDSPVFIENDFLHNEPVFTLETNESIYNAGGIIASNCRCAVASIPYD